MTSFTKLYILHRAAYKQTSLLT